MSRDKMLKGQENGHPSRWLTIAIILFVAVAIIVACATKTTSLIDFAPKDKQDKISCEWAANPAVFDEQDENGTARSLAFVGISSESPTEKVAFDSAIQHARVQMTNYLGVYVQNVSELYSSEYTANGGNTTSSSSFDLSEDLAQTYSSAVVKSREEKKCMFRYQRPDGSEFYIVKVLMLMDTKESLSRTVDELAQTNGLAVERLEAFRKKAGRAFLVPEVRNQEMVYIPIGGGFWIDKTEVTNYEFSKVFNSKSYCKSELRNDRRFNSANQPVSGVSFECAREFCGSIGKRLPTPEEWSSTAFGYHDWKYPWGDEEPNCRLAHFHPKSIDQSGCGTGRTAPVGSYPAGASPYGVLDMFGNVGEFVNPVVPFDSDWGIKYEDGTFVASPTVDIIGGNWKSKELIKKLCHIGKGEPYYKMQNCYGFDEMRYDGTANKRLTFDNVGFRCASTTRENPNWYISN